MRPAAQGNGLAFFKSMPVLKPPFVVSVLTGCVSALVSIAKVSTAGVTRMLSRLDDARAHYEPNRPLWLANDDRR